MINIENKNLLRNRTLDVLRGIAIYTMVLSNFAGELLKAPHPFFMTLIGSLAAPLFVLITGFLTGYSVLIKNYPLKYFLLRGFLTMMIGACIDIFLWKSYPFISVDILYLIGFTMPMTAVFMRFKISFKILIITIIFAMTPFLISYFGYQEKPNFPAIWKDGHLVQFEGAFQSTLKFWLIDGWFPLFFWSGITLTGGLLSELRLKREILVKKDYGIIFLVGLIFLGLGIIFWNQEFRYEARGNYTELFYPPTLSYFSSYFGAILILYLLVDLSPNLKIYAPIRLIGVSPLFFYTMHFIIIDKVIAPYFGKTPEKEVFLDLKTFCFTYFLLLLFCLFLALLIYILKKRFPNPPFLMKFIIGG